MKYNEGQEVRLGDRVRLWQGEEGIVVCSIDTREGTSEHPYSDWAHLKLGVMIKSTKNGLFHYDKPDEDLELIQRA